MRKKLSIGAAFAALLAAGIGAAALTAGAGPASVQATTTITSTITTGTTTTVTTITINRSAWPAHQRHGDSIGACNTAAAKRFHSRKAHIAKFHHGRPK